MLQRLKQIAGILGFFGLLLAVFATYLQPDFVVDLANFLWGCWQ